MTRLGDKAGGNSSEAKMRAGDWERAENRGLGERPVAIDQKAGRDAKCYISWPDCPWIAMAIRQRIEISNSAEAAETAP